MKIINYLVAASIAFVSTSCSFFNEYKCNGSFRLRPNTFSLQQQDNIIVAASRWNKFLGKQFFYIEDNGFCEIDIGDTSSASPTAKGLYHFETGRIPYILISPKATTNNQRYQALIIHELGHSIGLQHTAGPAIMTPVISSLDFTDIDLEECRRVNACGVDVIVQDTLSSPF